MELYGYLYIFLYEIDIMWQRDDLKRRKVEAIKRRGLATLID